MSNQQEEQQQQAFLSSLYEATELSIQLTQHSSSQNASQGVFRLELSSTTSSCSLERMGIRDPASSWPTYTYKVDSTLADFMMKMLLPAIQSSCNSTSTHTLQALTLSGCGRIPGFYPALVKILVGANNTVLSSLSILHWTDFYTSIAADSDNHALQLFSRLRHLNVHQYKLNGRCSQQTGASLGNLLGYTSLLESLNITTTGSIAQDECFWQSMARGVSQLQQLKQLSWTNNTTSSPSDPNVSALCTAISSRPLLEKLELSWPGMQPQHLVTLLSNNNNNSITNDDSHQQQALLSSLTLHHVTEENSAVLGQYLLDHHHSQGLQELRVSFQGEHSHQCNSGLSILEGSLRHRNLTTLALHGLQMDNDVAKTLQMMCLYNTTLTNLQVVVDSDSSDDATMDTTEDCSYVQDVLIGLASNATLQTVILGSTSSPTADVLMNEYTSLALCDVLQGNETLQQLTLPNMQLAPSSHSEDEECSSAAAAFHVAQGIANNTTLQRLYGIDFFTNNHTDLLVQALHYNKVLVDISNPSPSPLVSLLLQLNQLGRQHWVEPNFDHHLLLPQLLAKSDQTPASIQCILQTCLSYS